MESNLIQNLAFLGTTGSGKSATCNTLSGENPGHFIEGHTELSCTSFIDDHICWAKNLRLFDLPGFGDNRILEENINEIIQQIALKFADPFVNNTNQIDAFVLVVKLDPRAQTLKADLEHVRELFGTVAFESLILVLIYKDQSNTTPNFLEMLKKKMEAVTKILREGKQEEPNENWYCVWDNKRPTQGQERELLQKIKKLKPYTYEKFLQGQKEIKIKLDEKMKAEMQKQIEKVEKDHKLSMGQREREIQDLKKRYEKERAQISQKKDDDVKEFEKFLEGLSLISSEKKKTMEEFYKKIAQEKEFEEAKRQEFQESANQNNMQIRAIMEQSQEMMRKNLEQMRRTIEESNQRRMEIESQANGSQGGAGSLEAILLGSLGNAGGKIISSIGDKITSKIAGSNCSIF